MVHIIRAIVGVKFRSNMRVVINWRRDLVTVKQKPKVRERHVWKRVKIVGLA